MSAYVDTSALAKWYLNEDRSEEFTGWIQEETEAHISTLTVVEMRSLLARRKRNHEISVELELEVFATLQDDLRQGYLIHHPLEDVYVRGAMILMDQLPTHSLRTLDAIHLSIARSLSLGRLASADHIMMAAGAAMGMEIIEFG
jgi:hypothetical protein